MEGNLFIYIMPQIKAGKSENPAIAQQHFRANKKSDQPKLVALINFGGPSGGQPASQAAAAALRALRAALVNAYAFP